MSDQTKTTMRCGTCQHYRDVPNPTLGDYKHCVAHNIQDGWGPYTYMPVGPGETNYCWEGAENAG